MSSPATASRIPMWVKLAYTAFVAVLVPYYWIAYGPTNFLYFCDVALLMALVALGWKARCWRRCPPSASCCPRRCGASISSARRSACASSG